MNKKITLFVFLIVSLMLHAQDDILKFDKDYYKCENKWIALPKKEKDSTFMYAFVYLDRSAGFTLSYEGDFLIGQEGKFKSFPKSRDSRIIYRIPDNYALLAIIPDDKIAEMGLPMQPDWLPIYREGENKTEELIRRGYHFNHVGGSDVAIPVLLKAYTKEPHAKGLEFELSYAYNATGQPEKAIEVLDKALKNDPNNFMFLRELGYAYMLLNKPEEAIRIYEKGISLSDDKFQQSEMALNAAGIYYRSKNREKFEEWAKKVKKYADKDSGYYKNILIMESNFDKQ